jgi:general secretion pathway protein D
LPAALCLSACACFSADSAGDLARAAKKAERRGDTLQAFLLYSRAAALDPKNIKYQIQRASLQSTPTFNQTHLEPEELARAEALAAEDPNLDPDVHTLLAPVTLAPRETKQSFDLRGDSRTILEKVASEFGIELQFDADYQTQPNLRFKQDAVSFADAFRALELLTTSFVIPLSPHSALIARDTPQKRSDLAPAMQISIPIPERLSVQDAQEIVTAVQQTIELRRVGVDPRRRTVLLRDNASKLLAAQHLFSQLSRLRAQVEVEIEIVQVIHNSTLDYGLNLPTSASAVLLSGVLNTHPDTSMLSQFVFFGGGNTLMGIGVGNSSVIAMASQSYGRAVLDTTLSMLDGQAATMHVGDRYPIVTSQYIGDTSGRGTVYAPPPAVTFEDLGLSLKVTPTVHIDNEMTLDVESEYKLLGTVVTNGIPVISNRKFQGRVRLREGEWAVLAGLQQEIVGKSYTGIAGLSQLPWIGRFLRTNSNTSNTSELMLILKPRVTALPPWEEPAPAFWVGTDAKPLSMY